MIRRLTRRLRYFLKSGERERLLREELEAHLEMKVQELMEDGMTEPEARAAAHRQFGNLTQLQEASRGTWIAQWLNDLVQDVVYSVRTVRRQPGFTAVATLSAALGIGACSMLFGLANHALNHPLPVDDAARLVSISGKNVRRGKAGVSISYPDFEDLRQARSLQGLTAFFQFMPATIASNGEPQRYWGSVVTANYFDIVRPAFVVGRGFDADRDDRTGEIPKVVLSHGLWRSRFGSDREIVGRSIELNGQKVTVTGVTGPGFQGTEVMIYSDFWLPLSMLNSVSAGGKGDERLGDRGSQWLMATGRLRDGVSERTAAAEIETIGARLGAAYPATNKDRAFHVERAGQVNPGFRKMIVVFFAMLVGVAALVLCTACANVANLLLARASARQKEIATRLAIGAGRGRLIRQLLTESVMLGLAGGVGGYVLANLGAAAIGRSRLPLAMPVDLSVSLDYRVVLFCIALSALTGIVFGLVPALRATRPGLVGALKDEPVQFGQSRRFGLRNVLVVAQVAICMVLLICSGLFLRSLQSAQNIAIGFTNRDLLMMAFDPSLNRYSAADTRRIVDAIVEGAAAIPGVESATLTSSVPLNMEGTQNAFTPDHQTAGEEKNPLSADIYSIAPRFFETFGIRIIDGEDFRPGVPAEDIVIVNQALADRAFPNQNPVGRRIFYQGRVVRITALVATIKSRTIGEDPRPSLYFPMARDLRGNDSLTGMTLVLRTRGNPAGYVPLARQMIRSIDPTLAVFDVRTMDAQLSRALFFPRVAAFLFGLGGFMGVLISTIGIYGVISFAVARQTREIGVRMALGARREQVLGMVLKQGLMLTVIGAAIGLAVALALSRMAASVLYGISPTDTLTFAVVPLFLLLIALAACLIPARRAASLDPIRALRYEYE
jgi:predicted permease